MTYINEVYGAKYSKAHTLRQLVIQKGNVATNYVYAMQYKPSVNTVYVSRSPKQSNLNFNSSVLTLTGTASGHTQTFEYAGQKGKWFIGTKGKVNPNSTSTINWCTQIARVSIPGGTYAANTSMPRLSYLNRAGNMYYPGADLLRSEAAVSPDYRYFLLSTVDTSDTGYFSLYNLADINNSLDENGSGDVNIENIACQGSFKIPNFSTKVNNSIQGIDLDNNLNIYVSSQKSDQKNASEIDRHLSKIPWGTTEDYQWNNIDLSNYSSLNIPGCYSEFESVQVKGENDLYLTVSYHNNLDKKTQNHRIFEVTL